MVEARWDIHNPYLITEPVVLQRGSICLHAEPFDPPPFPSEEDAVRSLGALDLFPIFLRHAIAVVGF